MGKRVCKTLLRQFKSDLPDVANKKDYEYGIEFVLEGKRHEEWAPTAKERDRYYRDRLEEGLKPKKIGLSN